MSALASWPPTGEEKQEAAPVRHCKGVNNLDKVVIHEDRGSSAEVPRVTGHVPAVGSRRRSVALAMVLFEARFLGRCPGLPLSYVA